MHDRGNLSHVKWDCKYHVLFVQKYRDKTLYGKFREKNRGDIFGIYVCQRATQRSMQTFYEASCFEIQRAQYGIIQIYNCECFYNTPLY